MRMAAEAQAPWQLYLAHGYGVEASAVNFGLKGAGVKAKGQHGNQQRGYFNIDCRGQIEQQKQNHQHGNAPHKADVQPRRPLETPKLRPPHLAHRNAQHNTQRDCRHSHKNRSYCALEQLRHYGKDEAAFVHDSLLWMHPLGWAFSAGNSGRDSPAAQLPACQYGVLSKLDATKVIII